MSHGLSNNQHISRQYPVTVCYVSSFCKSIQKHDVRSDVYDYQMTSFFLIVSTLLFEKTSNSFFLIVSTLFVEKLHVERSISQRQYSNIIQSWFISHNTYTCIYKLANIFMPHIVKLKQRRSNSIADAMELHLFCINIINIIIIIIIIMDHRHWEWSHLKPAIYNSTTMMINYLGFMLCLALKGHIQQPPKWTTIWDLLE